MKVRTKALVAAGLLVALLLAGVVSFYASGSPDGLNKVAEDHGFSHTAEDSATSGSPFADYGTKGVGNERLAGGIAGVVGVIVVLGLGTGVAYAVRRRKRSGAEADAGTELAEQQS
ncbi:PDGLE domain-containing protein [Flindersiella endophytica]